MVQKTYEQLLADIAKEFSSGDLLPAQVQTILVNFVNAAKYPLLFSHITEFNGTDGVNTIATVDLAIGTKITVVINSRSFNYVLRSGTATNYGSLIIRGNDFAESTNEKYWILDGIKLKAFTEADLDESFVIRINHQCGYPFPIVSIYDIDRKSQFIRVESSPAAGQFSCVFDNNKYCDLTFHSYISGNFLAIIRHQ
jgi:hypothetical protein